MTMFSIPRFQVLSLIAVFPHPVSHLWLGVHTGIFLQGIGANGLRFLSP